MINDLKGFRAIKAKPVVTSNEIWDTNAYTSSVTTGVVSATAKSVYLVMSDHSVLFCPGRMINGFSDTNRIEIHKTYTFNMTNNGLIRAVDLMREMCTAVNADENSDLKIIYSCLVNKLAVIPELNRVSFTICREINVMDLNERVSKLYVADLNIVVSCKFDPHDCVHPDSHLYRRQHNEQPKQETIVTNASSCNIHIDYIDNEGNSGERFVNVFGRIIPIQPVKDATRSNGLHMSGHTLDENKRKINLNFFEGDFAKIDSEFDMHMSRESAMKSVEIIAQQEQLDLKKISQDMDIQYKEALNNIEIAHRAELARLKEANDIALANVRREIEISNAGVKQGTILSDAALQERITEEVNRQKLKLQKKADKEASKAQRRADEQKAKAQSEADQQKLKTAEITSTIDLQDKFYDALMKKAKLQLDLQKAEEENKLSLTQQVAKTIPAVATGVIGTIVAIKLFENSGSHFSSGMSNVSRW